MNTLKRFNRGIKELPAATAWYISDISEAKGRQELYSRQSPQKLKVLREHALIESAISSNRIEGVEIERSRIGSVIFGQSLLKDRNEEEIQGYRNALTWIHEQYEKIKLNETTIKKLHKISRGEIWDAGKYKEKDSHIIQRLPSGDTRVRFRAVSARQSPGFIVKMISEYHASIKNAEIHPLLLIAGGNLDFLCIHPFRDGNGRVSRLILLLQLYQAGYNVGRYISLERLIEEHKERYYETLEMSSHGWHQGNHDPWPYINFILYLLKKAYAEFMAEAEKINTPKGAKTEFVMEAILKMPAAFSLSMLQAKCPNVSRDMLRKILRDLSKKGKVEASGKGPGAKWNKKGNTLK